MPSSDAIFRASPLDAWLVAAALGWAAALGAAVALAQGPIPAPAWAGLSLLVAVHVWWGSNTVAHLHLHTPLFRSRRASRALSLWLTVLLGVPQTLWRERHLAHHAGTLRTRPLPRAPLSLELALIVAAWASLIVAAPRFFCFAWLPGWLVGLALCQAQGHFEHEGGVDGGISFYGRLYNRLWFNDGYHAEHHLRPAAHWSTLPALRLDAASSPSPPVLRFLDTTPAALLVALEHAALRSPRLQRYMRDTHERALAALLPAIEAHRRKRGASGPIERVVIVGGGLFPRSAFVARAVLPGARLVLVDASADHLDRARSLLASSGVDLARIDLVHARFDRDHAASLAAEADLVLLPLAFGGDRAAACAHLPERAVVVVHDWIWRTGGRATVVVALPLLKRLTLA